MAPIASSGMGFWGNVTSTIDWCEKNYDTTYYIAEFWNTISNIFLIIPPVFSIIRSMTKSTDIVLLICCAQLIAVGIGSWLFHMTLKYHMQLLDELPMLYASSFSTYVLTKIAFPPFKKSFALKIGLTFYALLVTILYLTIKHPLLFQLSYLVLIFVIVALDIYISKHKRCNPKLFYCSAFLYCTGAVTWTIDNLFCENLHQFRQVMPQFLIPLTQTHAIWHCLAAYGAYCHAYFCTQSKALEERKNVRLSWDWIGLKLLYDESKLK
ncbi:alkaline ceramidase 3-like protein [Dinothrombium tinctorium]|uniref:Alkaline ceramidase n=1 Tax=Dinothrombium tinctorium TaxID=1965070 RepID=A0A443RJH4_9ACAR|nr:alkaline ceramidase 3-like protein [Dinothrombium tinctorium]